MRRFVYEIYPISFMDSDGDGKGDLKGIAMRLDHLKALGVDYAMISPFFQSPMKDNGYDVSDYYAISSDFGTEADLRAMLTKAKDLGIGIVLDMVLNHTSTEHEWFKKWKSGDPAYADFYIEKPSKDDGSPPTNWKSKFGGIAWEQHRPGKWYLHLFDKSQADLNWSNPSVRAKLMQVLHHYVALGCSGFRFDVINLIDKSFFVDDAIGDGRFAYTDGTKVHEYMAEIRKQLPADHKFMTVGECSSVSLRSAMSYANKDKTELDSIFMFHHLKTDYLSDLDKFAPAKLDVGKLNQVLALWHTAMGQAGSTLANFWNNHDQPRSASRFFKQGYGDIGSKMLFAMSVCLPGDVYVYQGEEIGMINPGFSDPSDYRDVETLNYLKENDLTVVPANVSAKSRDASRTPMQWDDSPNAGFSKGTPWINVAPSYADKNVAMAKADPNSVFAFYKAAISFGKQEFLEQAGISFLPYREGLISFVRQKAAKKWVCTFNFTDQEVDIGLHGVLLWTNYATFKGVLKPYQFAVVES